MYNLSNEEYTKLHNEAGSEFPFMHEWAVQNAYALRKAGKKRP